jgi:hypothetical protein
MVIAGSVCAGSGAMLLGLTAVIGRLGRIRSELASLRDEMGRMSVPMPPPPVLDPFPVASSGLLAGGGAPESSELKRGSEEEAQPTLPLFLRPADEAGSSDLAQNSPALQGKPVLEPGDTLAATSRKDEPRLDLTPLLFGRPANLEEAPTELPRGQISPEERPSGGLLREEPSPGEHAREERPRGESPPGGLVSEDRQPRERFRDEEHDRPSSSLHIVREPSFSGAASLPAPGPLEPEPDRDIDPEPLPTQDLGAPPQPPATIIGTYNSGDNRYVMFSDGSIEAETPEGVFRFDSLDELKEFIAAGGEGRSSAS